MVVPEVPPKKVRVAGKAKAFPSVPQVKQKSLIQRTAAFTEEAVAAPPQDMYANMMLQRQQQAHLRQAAMLAPYLQMFSAR